MLEENLSKTKAPNEVLVYDLAAGNSRVGEKASEEVLQK